MMRAPTDARREIAPPPVMARPAAKPQPVSHSRQPKPRELMSSTAAVPRGVAISQRREAFRAFMQKNRLRPTEWAKNAGVPVGEILGYLTGRSRELPGDIAAALAAAAKVAPERMFE